MCRALDDDVLYFNPISPRPVVAQLSDGIDEGGRDLRVFHRTV